ncbi:S-Ena type endospore appendage [Halobacillus sp. A5]|uniref:S-Ena type endospore appendage n=1 Tax=Halobacillus sp. A5 TaxID=2880263 RepID=UPI0020A68821|nr:S-Ena type endospore appendage [Halobacillus sp. A5]MCP3027158.1 DUF3992 domain-containing protein [Halobacillus sp. A5]
MGKGCCNNLCSGGINDSISCEFVRDRVCSAWSVPQGNDQDVYMVSGVNVVASGYLSYDEGQPEFVTFRFYNGGIQVGTPIVVYEGSSVGFTATTFTSIEVSVLSGEVGDIASGQFCVSPRYQVNCETD